MNEKQKAILHRVMLRNDEYYAETVDHASHVALYVYKNKKWSEASVEGPLYLYCTDDAYKIKIYNRKLNNIFTIPLQNYTTTSTSQFVTLTHNKTTYGIWYFDVNDYKRVSNTAKEIMRM